MARRPVAAVQRHLPKNNQVKLARIQNLWQSGGYVGLMDGRRTRVNGTATVLLGD